MIIAYVEGLPIPSSSSALINLASVYLAGGSVKCWFALSSFAAICSCSSKDGNTTSLPDSYSPYTFR